MEIEVEISSALHSMVSLEGKNLTRDRYDAPEGACIEDILDMLGLTEVPTLLVLKGFVVPEDSVLEEGDTLKIFPVISGG